MLQLMIINLMACSRALCVQIKLNELNGSVASQLTYGQGGQDVLLSEQHAEW